MATGATAIAHVVSCGRRCARSPLAWACIEPTSVAVRRQPDIDAELLSFVGDLLLMQYEGANEAEFSARFLQVTPAVMAKGVEDTAFYRYNRLVSLNEGGG